MAIPLIAAAAAGGGVRALLGMRGARGEQKRKRKLIHEAFGIANERQNTQHADIRQGHTESLVARGLLQGGSAELHSGSSVGPGIAPEKIDAKWLAKKPSHVSDATWSKVMADHEAQTKAAAVQPNRVAARTLGGQDVADLEGEFALDRKDLASQRDASLSDVNAEYRSAITDAIAGGIGTGFGVYNAGQDLASMRSMPSTGPSPIREAMMGIDDPGAWWGGVNGLDPFGGPGSSWNRQGTMIGDGGANFDFNVG